MAAKAIVGGGDRNELNAAGGTRGTTPRSPATRPSSSSSFLGGSSSFLTCSILAFALTQIYCLHLIYPLGSLRNASGEGGWRQDGGIVTIPFPSLLDATAEELSVGLESGSFTSVDLVNTYFARIREVDGLNAVTEINLDAPDIAAALDAERASGSIRGPLHGLPILVKNNMATNDGMETTAGSFALLGAKVPRDAGVVAKLRAAGAIILGKSNLSQWSNFRSDNSSSGWSALGGQVYGAYCSDQNPSGSSSGSGVSSSIGLAFAALGTETDGSIVSPSQYNNIVGIKPTVGLTSRDLIIPVNEHQDTAGPMARTVKDAAYVLQAISGKDPNDNYTSAIPFSTLPDYVQACNFDGLRGARIGIPRNLILTKPELEPILKAFIGATNTIRRAGAIVLDDTNVTEYAANQHENGTLYRKVLEIGFFDELQKAYFSQLTVNPNNITSLAKLRDFTHETPGESYPDRDTAIWDAALAHGFGNTDPRFWPLYQHELDVAGPQGILGVLANHSLDALILPTEFASTFPARLGSPVITVPMGADPADAPIKRGKRGLVERGPHVPFGLSFIGPKWSEAKLISYAYAYEQRTQFRRSVKPKIFPKAELLDNRNMLNDIVRGFQSAYQRMFDIDSS